MLSTYYTAVRLDWDELNTTIGMVFDLYRQQEFASRRSMAMLGVYITLVTLEAGVTSPQEFVKKIKRALLNESDLGVVDPETGELVNMEPEEKEG